MIGFVLNDVGGASTARGGRGSSLAGDVAAGTNRDAIMELTGLPCLGEIPYDPELVREPSRVALLLHLAAISTALAPGR